MSVPVILFALRRESSPFLHTQRRQQPLPGAPCPATLCGPVGRPILVLETGVGTERTTATLDWLIRNHSPHLVLSTGFSGALTPLHAVGNVLVASEVLDLDGKAWPTTWPGATARGRLLTVPRMICQPEEKRALGEQYAADAADMETAAVAQWCHLHRIPFGCIRAISDDVHTALSPRLATLLDGGRVSPLRLLVALARSPGIVRELTRLARHTEMAARQLGQTLAALTEPGDDALHFIADTPPVSHFATLK